jgi:hypothetical protein
LSKSLTDLRAFLNRTSGGLRRLIPRPEDPAEDLPGAEVVVAPRRAIVLRRPEWLKALATERATITASLEGSAIRLLTYQSDRVAGWTEVPVLEKAGKGGQISDAVALGTAIDEAFERFELPRRHVAWGLPGFQAITRILDLPNLRGDELRLAIEEELERIIGSSASDFYVNWTRLPGRIRQRRVFVLAVPKPTVLTALEALEVANIRPYTMDLRPLAIARAIGRADAIVANLEEGSLDVVVVERNLPTMLRSLPLLGTSAARDAAQTRLVEETERTLAYYDDSNPDHPLDLDTPLYLTGSLATGIALTERLRAATRHPTGRLTSPIPAPPEFPVVDYLVNLGLALKRG